MTSTPTVKIIVLNWNGMDHVLRCLESLTKVKTENVDILVVDNHSTDGSCEEIRNLFPATELLSLNENFGYSGGNNRGIHSIADNPPDYICFLNNDTIVKPDFIDHLISAAEKYGQKCILGPKIYFMDQADKIWFNGGIVKLEKGTIKHEEIGLDDLESSTDDKLTDYITGCCLFLNWDLLMQLNGFDEQFNMYGEDVDLCLRAGKIGVSCRVIPDSIVSHAVSSSMGGRYSFKKQIKKLMAIRQLVGIHLPENSKNLIMFKTVLNDLKNLLLF